MHTGSAYNQFPGSTVTHGDLSDSQSNTNMNDSSKRSMTNAASFYNQNNFNNDQSEASSAQTAQWSKQKEFLKMSNTCQNKEKINQAIELLIKTCPS